MDTGCSRLPGGLLVIVVETERLRLRHFTIEDAPFILRLLNEPSFIQYITDKGVRTLDGARAYILSGPVASYRTFGFGLNQVELKDTGVPIGMCGLIKREALDDVDLGYAFLPEHWSNGYAREAAVAVMDTASRIFGLHRVVAVTNADNKRSILLLQKIGFQYETMINLYENEPAIKLFASTL
jgi:ribosomal-protein-alanine N-acetyltransferase